MDYRLLGDVMQALEIDLKSGEEVMAEAGSMMYMTGGIRMDARMQGGIWGGLKRKLFQGESFFLTYFKADSQGTVAFAAPYPGKVHVLKLAGESWLCEKDAFLCGYGQVDVDIAFNKRLGAGFFGGEGFILQKISGQGTAFIHAGGNLIEKKLTSGEVLKVDTGCLVAFESSVDYDISFTGGIKTTLFGGEGLFLAELRGPGRVILQTLPFARMADRILAASSSSKNEGGLLGNALENIGDD